MIEAVTLLLQVLDQSGIRYFACGSVASSIHGIARYTQDLDLIAEIGLQHVPLLLARLSAEFYADELEMRQSIRFGRAFNLIHLRSSFKIDVYPLKQNEFHQSEMKRSAPSAWLMDSTHTIQIPAASPEDTLLSKLVWYRQGGETSDRQWNDIMGIAQTRKLDWEYMSRWASPLGVETLLRKLKTETAQ